MRKIENWINVGSSLGVILGIAFLALQIRQNTDMMRSQARDSITEKQMMYSEWVTTEPEMAAALAEAGRGMESMTPDHRLMYAYFMAGVWREWENSYYQFERGLFEIEEFEPRMERWRAQMLSPSARALWRGNRLWYAPNFRSVVDNIVQVIDSEESGARAPETTLGR